jgi:hypothetical protein
MKLIKPGKADMSWPRQIDCVLCEAVLEIEPADIKRDSDYSGSFNGYYYDCPSCGGQPEVDSSTKHSAERWLEAMRRRRSLQPRGGPSEGR